jgi:hypothetical protein
MAAVVRDRWIVGAGHAGDAHGPRTRSPAPRWPRPQRLRGDPDVSPFQHVTPSASGSPNSGNHPIHPRSAAAPAVLRPALSSAVFPATGSPTIRNKGHQSPIVHHGKARSYAIQRSRPHQARPAQLDRRMRERRWPGAILLSMWSRPSKPSSGTGPSYTERARAHWCCIRTYLDSAASHGLTALDAITRALAAEPWPPVPRELNRQTEPQFVTYL